MNDRKGANLAPFDRKNLLTNAAVCVIIPKNLRSSPQYRGIEQLEARRAHNPEAGGSSPPPATIKTTVFYAKTVVFLTFRDKNLLLKAA